MAEDRKPPDWLSLPFTKNPIGQSVPKIFVGSVTERVFKRVEAEIAQYLRNQRTIDEIKRRCGVSTGEKK